MCCLQIAAVDTAFAVCGEDMAPLDAVPVDDLSVGDQVVAHGQGVEDGAVGIGAYGHRNVADVVFLAAADRVKLAVFQLFDFCHCGFPLDEMFSFSGCTQYSKEQKDMQIKNA